LWLEEKNLFFFGQKKFDFKSLNSVPCKGSMSFREGSANGLSLGHEGQEQAKWSINSSHTSQSFLVIGEGQADPKRETPRSFLAGEF
jgi:hypothetical protein